MRIREVAIEGFGVWADLRLGSIGDGVNLFYGPNEAGKTTLLQFLRTTLYGLTPERRARYLPPVHATRAGGSIAIEGIDGQLTIRRRFFASGDAKADSLIVAGPDGVPRDDRVLPALLGHIDEAVYRNVFAVGLREIQELGSLDDTAAADRLYKLATGLDRVSLVDVLHELTAARERIVSTTGAGATFNQLLPQRERLLRTVNDPQPVRQYVELHRQRLELAEQIRGYEAEAADLERAAREAEIAGSIHAKWHERRAVETELATLANAATAERQTLDRYQELARLVRRGKRRIRACKQKLAENRREIAELNFNQAIWRQQARVEAILDQEQWITTLDTDRGALAERLAAGETDLARLGSQLGLDAKRPFEDDVEVESHELQSIARAMRDAHQQLEEATAAAASAAKAAGDAKSKLGTALQNRDSEQVTSMMERTGKLVTQLRRRVQLDQRIDEMTRDKAELEEDSHELLARQLLPGWALAALGVPFVGGVGGLLGGLLLGSYMPGHVGNWLALFGGVTSWGTAAIKFSLERRSAARSDNCLAQLETVTQQLEDAREECAELDKTLPAGGGPLTVRLQAAEKELAAVDALAPLDASHQSAAQGAQSAEQLRAEAEATYRRLRQKWRQALIEAGLPQDLAPAKVKLLVRGRSDYTALARRVAADRAELARRQAVVEAFHLRLSQLQADLALPLAGQGLTDQFHALREHLREQAELFARRATLIRAARRIRRTGHKRQVKVDRNRRRLHALLDRAGVRDGAELRRLALQSARRDELIQKRDTLGIEIAAILGPHATEQEFETLVAETTRAQLDERWLDLSTRASQFRDKIVAAHEEIGRSQQQSQALVDDTKRREAELKLDSIARQLREAAGRWRLLAATEWFLTGVRATYERERQPETLRAASRFLVRLTEGRYTRVWTPLDQDVLRVDDAHGHSLPVEVLSRGTREQLFLSLRLALVESYRRRGIELPMILDDVLVNFDAGRTRAAAIVLGEFAAEGHQLLIFTCHEHIYRLFKSLGLPARELPRNPSRPGEEVLAEEPPLPPPPPPRGEPVVVPRPIPFKWVESPEPMRVITPIVEYATPPVILMAEEPRFEFAKPLPMLMAPAPIAPPVAVSVTPPVNGKSRARRRTVKFDPVHVPRGPFATAVWYVRVADEVANIMIDDELEDPRPEISPPRPQAPTTREKPRASNDPWLDFEPADEE